MAVAVAVPIPAAADEAELVLHRQVSGTKLGNCVGGNAGRGYAGGGPMRTRLGIVGGIGISNGRSR